MLGRLDIEVYWPLLKPKIIDLTLFNFSFSFLFSFQFSSLFLELELGLEWQDYTVTSHKMHRRM